MLGRVTRWREPENGGLVKGEIFANDLWEKIYVRATINLHRLEMDRSN